MLLKHFKKLFEPDALSSGENSRHHLELATAALLFEVARSDFEQDEAEYETIARHLKEAFDLSPDELERVTTESEHRVEHATSLYEFTRTINDHCTPKERIALIEAMWQVAYADGELSKYEDHLIRRTAELLYVAHSDFIRGKHRAQERLAQSSTDTN